MNNFLKMKVHHQTCSHCLNFS